MQAWSSNSFLCMRQLIRSRSPTGKKIRQLLESEIRHCGLALRQTEVAVRPAPFPWNAATRSQRLMNPPVGNYSSSGTLVCCQLANFIINSQIQVLMGSDHEGINNSQGKGHFATPVGTPWPARFQTAGNPFTMHWGQSGTQIKLPPTEKSFDNIM